MGIILWISAVTRNLPSILYHWSQYFTIFPSIQIAIFTYYRLLIFTRDEDVIEVPPIFTPLPRSRANHKALWVRLYKNTYKPYTINARKSGISTLLWKLAISKVMLLKLTYLTYFFIIKSGIFNARLIFLF